MFAFVLGYGSDKYTEVNRILAIRADETGGCIVARSQMQNIVEECPDLDRIIERRQAITVEFILISDYHCCSFQDDVVISGF